MAGDGRPDLDVHADDADGHDVRVLASEPAGLGPDFQSGNYGLDVLGIPGTNDQGTDTFGFEDRYAGYPQFRTGFSDVGNRDGWNPIFRDERTYSLTTNLTKVKGRHDIRGGYTLNYFFLDHWQPETGNPRGNFLFNGDTTGLRGYQIVQLLQPVPRRSCSAWLAT